MISLFNQDSTRSSLLRFNALIENLQTINDFERRRNHTISLIIGSMAKNPDQWDTNCQINIQWIGEQFIRYTFDAKEKLNKETIDDICSMCFRFLFEFYLSIKNDLSREFESARLFIIDNIENFHPSARSQIEYAFRDMPIAIYKQVANSDELIDLKNLSTTLKEAAKLKEQWDDEIAEKEKTVTQLKEALSQYTDAFNFVGLYQGFNELSQSKHAELKSTFFWLIVLASLIVLPILSELIIILTHREDISQIQDALIISVLPLASFTIIAIYYFRVLLFNYKSTKSQILQIDLRKTLCRFIQQYAQYSKEIKTKDHNPLDRFEAIIFSGIVSGDEQLPSTYDGIEQLIKLVKSAKG